jgi:hypothetical protein
VRTLVFGRAFRCARAGRALPQRVPQATLAGRADNGAAIYVIPGRDNAMRRSTPDYVPIDSNYVPWPHGQEMPAEHRRRRVSPRVRAAILILVGMVIAFLALGAVAAVADDEPAPDPTPGPTGTHRVQETPPPGRPDDDFALAGDVVWGRRA